MIARVVVVSTLVSRDNPPPKTTRTKQEPKDVIGGNYQLMATLAIRQIQSILYFKQAIYLSYNLNHNPQFINL